MIKRHPPMAAIPRPMPRAMTARMVFWTSTLDFPCRQCHLWPQKRLHIMHQAGQQPTQRPFLGRSGMIHD